MKKYKVLNANMVSPWQNYQYKIGKQYHCNDFDDRTDVECSRGFYATDIDGLPYTFRCTEEQRVFECEVSGRSVEIQPYKCRYENITLIREIEKPEIIKLAKLRESEIGYLLSEVLYPMNPLEITEHPEIDREKLLKSWASIWASIWDSAGDTIGDSVGSSVGDAIWVSIRDSVGDSIWDSIGVSIFASIGDSVWDSVRASIGAYISSLFPGIKTWKYIEHPEGVNPFQPGITLWRAGYVPSFDGKTWRLHTGKNAEVVLELKL